MTSLERLLVGVLVAFVALFGCFLFGKGEGRAEGKATIQALWDKDRADMVSANEVLVKQHSADILKVVSKHNETNRKNSDEHDVAIKEVRTKLAAAVAESKRLGGLRIPASACKGSGLVQGSADAQATGTSQRDEEATSTIALPEAIEHGLWSIVGQADEVTEQLRSCQGWIIDNGFYGETAMN